MPGWQDAPVVGEAKPAWESAPLLSDTGPATLNPNLAAQGRRIEGARETMRSGMDFLSQRDPGIDYRSGVNNAAFRAGFSRMSNEAEKARFLDRSIGKDNWTQDSFGAYVINPSGLRTLGIKSDRPVALDEQVATLYDVADVAGDLPAIAGGVAGGMAASGAGLLPGLGMAALGAAGGKALDEVAKNLQGSQVKGPGEVFGDIAGEGAMSALGEGAVRAIAPVARFALGPGAARMTPEKKALADSAKAQGFAVKAGSVTDAPLLARWEGMVEKIFGDLTKEQNERAAAAGVQRLKGTLGTTPEEAGEAIASSIRKQRVTFAQQMERQYSGIDALVGQPFVPTTALKDTARQILESVPQTQTGESAFIAAETRRFLNEINTLQPVSTVAQMQRVRTMLREAAESPDLVPGLSKHDARLLRKAADQAFDDARNIAPGIDQAKAQAAIAQLRAADAAYKQGIRKFDLPTISAITRDASRTGAVDADRVVEYLIKPDRLIRLRHVKSLVPANQWAKVQSAHANELVENITQGTTDPLKTIFDGRKFRDALDKYGRGVLEEVHGKRWVDDAYEFANALMLANKRATLSGGIVAANIALHPVVNLPRLVWIRTLAALMERVGTFKYLTEGIRLGPETKAGAAALARIAAQAQALARDETGSARFTLTEPE